MQYWLRSSYRGGVVWFRWPNQRPGYLPVITLEPRGSKLTESESALQRRSPWKQKKSPNSSGSISRLLFLPLIAQCWQLESYIHRSGLETSLLELVKMRASQINGCAYCLDMHSKDARAAGETEQRLYVLTAWREAPFYSAGERAALAWTEAVTLVSDTHVPDDVFDFVRKHFSEEELVNLTMAVVTINGWNRLEVSFRGVAGSYKPLAHQNRVGSE